MIDLRSVDERLVQGRADQRPAFERFRAGMGHLADQVYANFDVSVHPSCAKVSHYECGPMRGAMTASSGPEIDWMIDSWIGNPEQGFSNHHLTCWLPPEIGAPHLGMAIGTIPQLFFFIDLIPRRDPWVHDAHLDRYHRAFNQQFMDMEADRRFSRFVSQEHYIRNALSPVGLCVQGEPTPDNIAHCLNIAEQMLTQWIAWVKDPEFVPEDERDVIAARDLAMRRTICQRDPANIVAEKVLGPELTETLVRVMWGADRSPS